MRRIAIVGAGQSGLELALGLQAKGYEVNVVTNRSAEDVRNGKVMSSQCMFDAALQTERDLGLNFWEKDCPPVEGIGLYVPHPEKRGEKFFGWAAQLDKVGQAVDQRLKMPGWMDEFEKRGGKLTIQDVGVAELEAFAASHDLVLLAAGKGEIVRMFERDDARSTFDKPMRALALTYVKGMTPMKPFSHVTFNLIPGVGEYFCFPGLTLSGPCEIMVFEGVPGGPMDRWAEAKTPAQHLAMSLDILDTFLPWEADRCRNVELTDDKGILSGSFAPTVRKPVLTLPSGRQVFGMADAVVVNDPITGQGSNSAAKCSKVYLDEILARGGQDLDAAWMTATFEKYWDYVQHVTAWTNTLLMPGPPPEYLLKLLATAGQVPALASIVANGFDDPSRFNPWWFDGAEAEALIAKTMAA